ncbi:MAG TPA: sulfurtransferase [Anaerolineae bacterium]|nr:sulfurtransferase [Anaerolineae bacterium]
MYKTLIDTHALAQHLNNPNWVIVDCRFDLADTAVGRQQYQTAHIPGAVYAHLDNDLSSAPVTDRGRHPLPSPQTLAMLFSRLGIGEMTQVVAYDNKNGAIASRLWWELRYMGHEAVAVLDGGWAAWQKAGLPVRAGIEENDPAMFTGRPKADWLVRLDEVSAQPLLIDSRGPARYRGEEEPLDPVAGHIPGAVNFFFQENWSADGRYLPTAEMRANLEAVLGNTKPDTAVFYCGSGVTACVNLLALAHAGLGNGRLYVGSWSEWCSDSSRPIATGDEPQR